MLETALQRASLVDAEIMRCLVSKKPDDTREFIGCRVSEGFRRIYAAGRRRVKLSENEVGNVSDRGDEIDRAGRDRAAWHSIEFSLLFAAITPSTISRVVIDPAASRRTSWMRRRHSPGRNQSLRLRGGVD